MTIHPEYNDYIEKCFDDHGRSHYLIGKSQPYLLWMDDSFDILLKPAKYFVPVDSNNLCQKDYHKKVFNSISRRLHLCIFSFSIILWFGLNPDKKSSQEI